MAYWWLRPLWPVCHTGLTGVYINLPFWEFLFFFLVPLQIEMFIYHNKISCSTRESLKASYGTKILYHKIYYMTPYKRCKIWISIRSELSTHLVLRLHLMRIFTYAFILDNFGVVYTFMLKSSSQCIPSHLQLFRQVLVPKYCWVLRG
jgi:hypothetical protein